MRFQKKQAKAGMVREHGIFKCQAHPCDILSPTRTHLLILPKLSTIWKLKIQIHEPTRAIHIPLSGAHRLVAISYYKMNLVQLPKSPKSFTVPTMFEVQPLLGLIEFSWTVIPCKNQSVATNNGPG